MVVPVDGGDARSSSAERVRLLESTVGAYSNSLRWGYFEEIEQYQRIKGANWADFSLKAISRHRIVSYENLSKITLTFQSILFL